MSVFALTPPFAVSQAGFLAFLRAANGVGIPTAALPDNSQDIINSYTFALELVNTAIQQVSALSYALAVYNLAADTLINFAQDQPGQTYFATARDSFKINSFVSGTISSTSDESTSSSMVVPKQFENLTLGNLQNLKTPYGRQYLAIAQQFGTLWGST